MNEKQMLQQFSNFQKLFFWFLQLSLPMLYQFSKTFFDFYSYHCLWYCEQINFFRFVFITLQFTSVSVSSIECTFVAMMLWLAKQNTIYILVWFANKNTIYWLQQRKHEAMHLFSQKNKFYCIFRQHKNVYNWM